MNIKEIAKIAGVSPSTISKIINNKDQNISEKTREKVLKVVKDYNYTPFSSIDFSNHKTWTIAVLFNSQYSFNMFLDGIIYIAQKDNYNILTFNSYNDIEQELKNITSICNSKVDGMIWEPVSDKSLEAKKYIDEKNIQYFTIGSFDTQNNANIPYSAICYQLTQELINRKHKKIACLIDKRFNNDEFINGYRQCLFDNNLKYDENMVFNEFNDVLLYRLSTHKITGVVSSSYLKAIEFYQLMLNHHYTIPNDFSLISVRDDCEDIPSTFKISTYTINNTAFSKFVCKKLIQNIEKSSPIKNNFSHIYKLDNSSTLDIPYNLRNNKILVVGSINIDTYLNISEIPQTGRTISTGSSSIYPGGKGINQSIGASKLGHHVALIGNIGSDPYSDNIYHLLNTYNVDTIGIKRCQNIDTGKAFIFVESSGNSLISILQGANGELSPYDIRKNEHLFDNTGYCLIQSEVPIEAVIEACKMAHKHNVKTIFKPSACNKFYEELIGLIDIIVPNEQEARQLCPFHEDISSQAEELLSYGVETVIITLGENGCYARTNTWENYFSTAHFVSVDNTGASDAFISALASYLQYGFSLSKSIRIANYAAGFCVSREGVVPALIDKTSLESYIKQNDPDLLVKTINKPTIS